MPRTYNDAVVYDVEMYDYTPGANAFVSTLTGVSPSMTATTGAAATMTPTTSSTPTATMTGA